MNEWTKEQLEEMFGDDVVEQLAFLAGCTKHRLANDPVIPDGWIVPDDVLKKFAELIVRECLGKVAEAVYAREMSGRYYPDSDGKKILKHFGVEE